MARVNVNDLWLTEVAIVLNVELVVCLLCIWVCI